MSRINPADALEEAARVFPHNERPAQHGQAKGLLSHFLSRVQDIPARQVTIPSDSPNYRADTMDVLVPPISAAEDIVDLADLLASERDQTELLAVVSEHPDVLAALRSSLEWVRDHGLFNEVEIEADRTNDGPLIEVMVDSGDNLEYWRSISSEFRAWWLAHYGVDMLYYLNVTIH